MDGISSNSGGVRNSSVVVAQTQGSFNNNIPTAVPIQVILVPIAPTLANGSTDSKFALIPIHTRTAANITSKSSGNKDKLLKRPLSKKLR